MRSKTAVIDIAATAPASSLASHLADFADKTPTSGSAKAPKAPTPPKAPTLPVAPKAPKMAGASVSVKKPKPASSRLRAQNGM